MNGWTSSVNLLEKVKKTVGKKASDFFTTKTTNEVMRDEWQQGVDERRAAQQALFTLDGVVDQELALHQDRIVRLHKCKKLFSNKFLEKMMEHAEREIKVTENSLYESGLRAGFLSKAGHAVGIEVRAISHFDLTNATDFIIIFGSHHPTEGDMNKTVGPINFEQALMIEYPQWFNEIVF